MLADTNHTGDMGPMNTLSRQIARIVIAAFALPVLFTARSACAQPVAQGPEFVIGTAATMSYQSLQRTSAVSRAADGSFVIVWNRFPNGSLAGVAAQRYDADGAAIGTEFLVSSEEDVQRGLGSQHPAVAHTTQGEFVVVWQGRPAADMYSGFSHVIGRRVSAQGEKLGTEFQISEGPSYSGYYGAGPDLAAMENGAFVVVWRGLPDAESSQIAVLGQRVNADGTPLGTGFMVNTFSTADVSDPQVGTRGDGSFVVVWTAGGTTYGPAPDGAYAGVFGQRFANNGARAGTEFQVNTFTTYSEDQPDIAVKADGSFVVVWRTQYGDEFSNTGGGGPPICGSTALLAPDGRDGSS
jgi:hypothetical protein